MMMFCERTQRPLCHCMPPEAPTAGTSQLIVLGKVAHSGLTDTAFDELRADILFLKHACNILRQSSNPVCGFSMMEQVRLCAVWPMENYIGSSMSLILGWTTV